MPRLTASALLFDMDGTLIDSHAAVRRIWTEFATRFDLSVEEILETSHGVRMIETILRHAPAGTDAQRVHDELAAIEITDSEGIVALPGATQLFASLAGQAVALVTSAPRDLAEVRMGECHLPLPRVIVTAEDVASGKPDPAPYLLAAERLGVDPTTTIVFEDAEAGVLSGLAAGATVVVVGDLDVEATRGLTRIADYRGATVTVEDGVIAVML